MTCDEFRRSYLEHVVSAAGEAHLRECADCQRVTPELDVLRARLGDPAVWETPGSELRSNVVGAVVSAARPTDGVAVVGAGDGGSPAWPPRW